MKHTFAPVQTNVSLVDVEHDIAAYWEKEHIVEKYLHRNDASDKRFSFLDGPITANNPMGVHHAWGRTYKDLWQRFHTMRGYKGRYQNGFDCQGLWVEVEVEKELGVRNKKDIENLVEGDKRASIAKFVELCKERVKKFSGIQTEQSKRLGYFMDWDHSYYTMSDENNYMIWHFLKTCFDKGWIYKGKDSVPWCPRCETAISQHEMLTEDYKELTHETVFLKLPITTKGWEHTSLVIWTTTPWTIPANVAVGVNVSYTYAVWEHPETKDRIVILSKDADGNVPMRHLKNTDVPVDAYIFGADHTYKFVKEFSGKDLVGLTYEGPFDAFPRVQEAKAENPKTFHTVVDGSDIVVSEEGTGLLHVAPGAGKEDFDLGKKEHLPIISVISDDASYLSGMDEFSAKNAKKHPELIIDTLKSKGDRFLLKTMQYTHRYPACWRCKTELVWKVAEEWYIAMDVEEKTPNVKGPKTLREQMKNTAKMINWHPSFGLDRELDWLSNMHDWLISKKNRYWGLALPIYECPSCGHFEIIGSKEELQKRAVHGWERFEGHTPHKPFIDEVVIACEKCGQEVHRINDVGNVWLDAGIVPFSTMVDPKTKKLSYTTDKTYWKEWFPVNFITESFPGQFKNWFYSMIAMSTVLEKRNPFETVLGYASVVGEDGRPMHKSWGNAIEFNEGAEKIGADVMRWMFIREDPEQNVLFGYKKADETRRKFHLMLWNTYNFFVTYARVDGFSPGASFVPSHMLDQWILSRLHSVIKTVTVSLSAYDVKTAAGSLEAFVADFSQWYVRRSRDRVGATVEHGDDKTQCYETLYTTLVTLCTLLAPCMPYMTDHMYQNLTKKLSVHLADWPEADETLIHKDLEEQMVLVREIVERILSKRKEVKIGIRQPLHQCTINNAQSLISPALVQLIKDETNIKSINVVLGEGEMEVVLDTTLTEELRDEGKARETVRAIQLLRKEKGCTIDGSISVTLPKELETLPEALLAYIKKETLATSFVWGNSLEISTGTN